MKVYYKGVLCNLATYRVMGKDKPALYYIDSPDQETMLKAGFVDVQPCLCDRSLGIPGLLLILTGSTCVSITKKRNEFMGGNRKM